MGAPVSILQYFDVNDKVHLEQYAHLVAYGSGKWANSFITQEMNIAYPQGWFISLSQKLGQAYLDATSQTADLTDEPTAIRYAKLWCKFNGIYGLGV